MHASSGAGHKRPPSSIKVHVKDPASLCICTNDVREQFDPVLRSMTRQG